MQGVCADCWGSKGGRQFWVRKQGPRASGLDELFGVDPLFPLVGFGAVIALVAGAVLWIVG